MITGRAGCISPAPPSLLLELEGCRAVRDSARAAERRKKTVVVGDMQPLAAALPTLPMATGGEPDG